MAIPSPEAQNLVAVSMEKCFEMVRRYLQLAVKKHPSLDI